MAFSDNGVVADAVKDEMERWIMEAGETSGLSRSLSGDARAVRAKRPTDPVRGFPPAHQMCFRVTRSEIRRALLPLV